MTEDQFTQELGLDPYLAQSNKGLTIEASTKREAGASFIDMKLVAVDAQLWQALRQPQLKVVDEEGHEYVPVMSKSATEPVTPGGSPAATTVYWHYVLADWPVEAEHFDLYYELSGSIALPEEVTADFSGLHINIVEGG